jgi:hypothetical protein
VLFGEYFKSFPFSVILGKIREKPPRIPVDLGGNQKPCQQSLKTNKIKIGKIQGKLSIPGNLSKWL